MGGSVAAIESGWMQARIADSAYDAQQAIERGETVVVGVNAFVEPAKRAPQFHCTATTSASSANRSRGWSHSVRNATRRPWRSACAPCAPPRPERRISCRIFSRRWTPERPSARSARFFARPSASIVPRRGRVIVDHVAIVVADLEQALQLYTQTLGFRQVYRETIADQGVEASDSRPANPSWNSCVRWSGLANRSLPR